MISQGNEISVEIEPELEPEPEPEPELELEPEPEPEPEPWCIYRVPSKLRNVNKASYTPQLLSIGPFHHGSPKLKDMERHKQIYYEKFLGRCSKNEDELKGFVNQHQDRLLSCYAGTIESEVNFVNVILVDACFIIELFITDVEPETKNHHILRSYWMRKAVQTDLILFENQIPYFFLEELYDFVAISSHDSVAEPELKNIPVQHQFLTLACKFFEEYTKKKPLSNGVKLKHFTDLVRHFVCTDKVKGDCVRNQKKCKYDVRKLKAAGVKFIHLAEPFVIEPLSGGVNCCGSKLACLTTELKLTRFWATYDAESVIRNIMALEQLIYPKKAYICSYFLLLSQLVNTVEDIDLLIKDGVVENLLGSNKSVEKLINSFCMHIVEEMSCYSHIYDQLNEQYETSLGNRRMATLKHVYFKNLWTGSATILGLVVLFLSIIGTINSLTSHKGIFHVSCCK